MGYQMVDVEFGGRRYISTRPITEADLTKLKTRHENLERLLEDKNTRPETFEGRIQLRQQSLRTGLTEVVGKYYGLSEDELRAVPYMHVLCLFNHLIGLYDKKEG